MARRRPLVLLDCDGILADFYAAALDTIAELSGVRHDLEALHHWEIFASIGDDDLRERTYTAMNAPGYCLERIQPMPEAAEGLARLRRAADVLIVTAPFRSASWPAERLRWLHEHLGVPADQVVFSARKHEVAGDLFVDDNPAQVQAWEAEHRPRGGVALVWDRPYNRRGVSLERVGGWDDLLDRVARVGTRRTR